MNIIPFKVCVECCTFNQSQYITQTLDGFCMQETLFPFVCCIIDDASTDGEQQVLRDYLQIHFLIDDPEISYTKETDDAFLYFAQNRLNKFCYFAVILLKENQYCKTQSFDKIKYIKDWMTETEYLAFCEGDDYWIDSKKLQKQVDLLDNNKDAGLCYTQFKVYLQESGSFERKLAGSDCKSFEYLLLHPVIGTLTTVCRASLVLDYYDDINPESYKWLMGDFPMWLYVAQHAQLLFWEEPTAVYRVLSESASHSKSFDYLRRCNESLDEIRKLYINKYYSENKELLQLIEQDLYRRNFRDSMVAKELRESFKYFILLKNKKKNDYKNYLKFLVRYIAVH